MLKETLAKLMLRTIEKTGKLIGAPAHDSPALSDLDRAFVEADETSDWPEFLPVERIKRGPFDFALAALLFANLVALGGLFCFYFTC